MCHIDRVPFWHLYRLELAMINLCTKFEQSTFIRFKTGKAMQNLKIEFDVVWNSYRSLEVIRNGRPVVLCRSSSSSLSSSFDFLSSLLLDDALKLAMPLTNGAISGVAGLSASSNSKVDTLNIWCNNCRMCRM